MNARCKSPRRRTLRGHLRYQRQTRILAPSAPHWASNRYHLRSAGGALLNRLNSSPPLRFRCHIYPLLPSQVLRCCLRSSPFSDASILCPPLPLQSFASTSSSNQKFPLFIQIIPSFTSKQRFRRLPEGARPGRCCRTHQSRCFLNQFSTFLGWQFNFTSALCLSARENK